MGLAFSRIAKFNGSGGALLDVWLSSMFDATKPDDLLSAISAVMHAEPRCGDVRHRRLLGPRRGVDDVTNRVRCLSELTYARGCDGSRRTREGQMHVASESPTVSPPTRRAVWLHRMACAGFFSANLPDRRSGSRPHHSSRRSTSARIGGRSSAAQTTPSLG
jgi:hypothetical protein